MSWFLYKIVFVALNDKSTKKCGVTMTRVKRLKKKKKLWIIPVIILAVASIAILAAIILLVNAYVINSHDSKTLPPEKAKNETTDNSYKKESAGEKTEKPLLTSVKTDPKPVISSSCLPENFKNFFWEVVKDGQVLKEFNRSYELSFPDAGEYSDVSGVTCFRGNNYRNSASYGFADIKEEKLEKVWFSKTGYIDIWTGVGWTGQPAIIKWDDDLKKKMNLFPAKKKKPDLKEVIYATLDGKIYFLDLDDGKPTRNPIDVGYPHKGSVAVDPRGYPLLYTGQGINEKNGKRGPIGFRVFNLIDQKLLHFIDGYDRDAIRRWTAFDSGALIDKKTDTLVECGENGILYTVKLNTDFDKDKSTISLKPDAVKYRYHSPISTKIGVENSPVIYRNYIYFADNSGLLQCIDLNTMKPLWIRDVTDDTDSTMVLEEISENKVFIYTACELDRQGKDGYSYIRKIHALTGDLVWEQAVKCSYDSHTNGGALASPVLGRNDIQDLVIFNIAKTGNMKNGSKLLALDKESGKEVWTVDIDYYCWSSPTAVYTKEGKSYLIVCDSGGFMRLIEGVSGKELDRIPLEANIEASPAVYENMIVVGTRGQKIWGIKLK